MNLDGVRLDDEGVPASDFWTNRLLRAIASDPVARRIVWVLVWRNAHQEDRTGPYYAPWSGNASAPDFVRFCASPFVLPGDELPVLHE